MTKTVEDDRTEAELKAGTHTWLVVGTDKFMSGWGGAEGGQSVAAWATDATRIHAVEAWVRSRPEMRHVRIILDSKHKWRPRRFAHYHVYAVRDGHPSLR